ncbi:hypothetical protein A33I_09965 [Alkalihalophilus marmarensis DSM 21297]|jgi:transporter family-2 protein|uniref:Uncharacterized protein n=1 Tax=Alkalihalophilus marmarensis DSM 21297 TaxID=1188261 RepID=U6SSA8_9BACI|nr:hypothetical protein A33I_09965 [Alkalihalophilus marmarensis DSM 21297]
MRYMTYLLALIAGAALSFEGAIYGELGKTIGKLETSFYNFFVGSIILGLLWIIFAAVFVFVSVNLYKFIFS